MAPPISSPRKRIDPSLGASVPAIRLKVVLLPDPLGPIRPRISPWPSVNETFWTAVNPPKRRVSPRTANSVLSVHRTQGA